jgi:hypothetical protein
VNFLAIHIGQELPDLADRGEKNDQRGVLGQRSFKLLELADDFMELLRVAIPDVLNDQ